MVTGGNRLLLEHEGTGNTIYQLKTANTTSLLIYVE